MISKFTTNDLDFNLPYQLHKDYMGDFYRLEDKEAVFVCYVCGKEWQADRPQRVFGSGTIHIE
jgi:hypothetical protein